MCCSLTWKRSAGNQLSFQRYLGPVDYFQHVRSTEMPNRCTATAQIWHHRIGEAPKILAISSKSLSVSFSGDSMTIFITTQIKLSLAGQTSLLELTTSTHRMPQNQSRSIYSEKKSKKSGGACPRLP